MPAELQAVLLAAGGSTRLGRSKQLLELHGEPLVHRGARVLTMLTPHVVVMTGARAEAVSEALKDLAVQMRHNAQWREGMGGSIAQAVRNFSPEAEGALIMLCDQYRIGAPDLNGLVEAWEREPGRITAAQWPERFGPPVVFPKRFFPALARLRGDLGARQLLVEHRAQVKVIDLPNAAFDVDDASDLARMRRFEASGEA